MRNVALGILIGAFLVLTLGLKPSGPDLDRYQLVCTKDGMLIVVNLETAKAKYVEHETRQTPPGPDAVIVNPECIWAASSARDCWSLSREE